MKIKPVFLLLIIIFLIPDFAFGVNGEYAGAFLENGIGARALGMGGAFVSIANDGSAPYWNPAGVGYIKRFNATAMHAFLFDNLANHDYISMALPLPGEISVSVSWIRLGVDDIPVYGRLEDNVDIRILDPAKRPTGKTDEYFSASENAYFFTFSRHSKFNADLGWFYFGLPMEFGFGATIKYINNNIYEYTGTGTGIDLGLLTNIDMAELVDYNPLGWLSAGVNLQDISKTTITWSTPSKRKDQLKRNLKTGVSYRQPIVPINCELIVAADTDTKYGYKRKYGMELIYNSQNVVERALEKKYYHSKRVLDLKRVIRENKPEKTLSIRAGYDDGDLTAGAGLKINHIIFDYAFVKPKAERTELGNTHRISMQVIF